MIDPEAKTRQEELRWPVRECFSLLGILPIVALPFVFSSFSPWVSFVAAMALAGFILWSSCRLAVTCFSQKRGGKAAMAILCFVTTPLAPILFALGMFDVAPRYRLSHTARVKVPSTIVYESRHKTRITLKYNWRGPNPDWWPSHGKRLEYSLDGESFGFFDFMSMSSFSNTWDVPVVHLPADTPVWIRVTEKHPDDVGTWMEFRFETYRWGFDRWLRLIGWDAN